MKKLLLMTALMMLCSISSINAFTSCEGGTIITRNKYTDAKAPAGCDETTCPATTKTFCKSNGTMNWWSALTWCDAQGGNLATFREMCPGVAPASNNVEGACPALQGTVQGQWSWSGYPIDNKNVLDVSLYSGAVIIYGINNVNHMALCE